MSTSERSRSQESTAESVGVVHLLAAGDALSPGRHITLCGAKVRPSIAMEDKGGGLSPAEVRYCPDCVREACRWNDETAPAGEGGHPSWCSLVHCYRQEDDGVRVHVQRPVCWIDDTGEVQFTSGLVHPDDDDCTYLELTVNSLRLRDVVHAVLSMAEVRRLREQLSAYLDAADSGEGPVGYYVGECGHRVPGGPVWRVGPCHECGEEPTLIPGRSPVEPEALP